jgi:hypothetical protein
MRNAFIHVLVDLAKFKYDKVGLVARFFGGIKIVY